MVHFARVSSGIYIWRWSLPSHFTTLIKISNVMTFKSQISKRERKEWKTVIMSNGNSTRESFHKAADLVIKQESSIVKIFRTARDSWNEEIN